MEQRVDRGVVMERFLVARGRSRGELDGSLAT